ncbi:bromodomain associated domain-containing protein [Nannizzia gypsea CBS 118893]|uniref:Transcription initiation factor TFIID subunit 8 n=1 Tax=Arthroderma gypseum (strain ATCC MYA-4604 / CBS 118893) TaxID=535722 RepID=E4UZN9_ARTGP|nr:bromodomain associated domain-containing protein [Nannizzia gypsea CBS 118893]EFR03569.1 bromodomain associated domain-containing protein [Nannizzia gypsea CBS 118893]
MALTNPTQTPPSPQSSAKRPSVEADGASPARKQRQAYRRHHRLRQSHDLAAAAGAEILNDSISIDSQLNASIVRVLDETGFDNVEPVVLDSFRNNVEEHMLHFLSYVRQSMTSSRRVQPIPQDFEHALRYHSIRVDSLRPHLSAFQRTTQASPATPSSKPSLLTPPPEEGADDDEDDKPIPTRNYAFLGPELNSGDSDPKKISYIPKNFPSFPSKHTYQETPVFATKRETNPEKIRERATEEGRLGEEALRKLTRAAREGQGNTRAHRDKTLWGRKNESMDSMFDKTLKALTKSTSAAKQPDGSLVLDLGPIVNSNRVYWRKASAPAARPDPQRTTTTATAMQVE